MESVQRSQIARLLATENITVVQGNVSTASFNVKTRVLTLPMWKDITTDTEDHLVGHEVGHALYTPEDGWHDAVCDASRGPSFKSYLNVVEDARIEKLVQRKYPGLKKSFIKSYRVMLADGFFGGTIEKINKMGFIDRINTYYKCGVSAGIVFSQEEKQFLPMLDALESWDDAEKAAEILFDYCLEKEEERKEEQQESDEEEADQDTDGDTEDYQASSGDNDGESVEEGSPESSGNEEVSGGESADSGEGEEETEQDSTGDSGQEGGTTSDNPNKNIESKTDEILRDNIENQMTISDDCEVYNLRVDAMPNWKDRIIGYKDVLKELRGQGRVYGGIDYEIGNAEKLEAWGGALYKEYQTQNKKTVNHMVKEFEMRKSASAYARTNISKTGVIDTLKMNNYKLTDDIFRKVSVVEDGKNHGFIMYLDMSGSMCDYMYETVEQTILLAQFCKQIGVPYRVYGFTDAVREEHENQNEYTEAEDVNLITANMKSHGRFIELFSNHMNAADMSMMIKSLLAAYYRYASKGTKERVRAFDVALDAYRYRYDCQMPRLFALGGTPLNLMMLVAMPLGMAFRKKYNIEVLNTFVLSDGESASIGARTHEGGNRRRIGALSNNMFDRKKTSFISVTNPHNNKTYNLIKNASGQLTTEGEVIFNMYRDYVGGNLIGYRIERQRKQDISYVVNMLRGLGRHWGENEDDWDLVKKQGWCHVTDAVCYDEVFVIGSKSMNVLTSTMEKVQAGSLTKAKLRTAFSKSQNSSKNSRKMLTELAKRIA